MIQVKLKANGGWIDVAYDGATIVMAAVGPPLNILVKEPKTLDGAAEADRRARTLPTYGFGRLARSGRTNEVDEAEWSWEYRADSGPEILPG